MSADIYWLPSERGKNLNVSAPSRFIDTLTRAFGEGPWTLDESALPILKGIMAVDDAFMEKSAWKDLYAALETHGEIKIWVKG